MNYNFVLEFAKICLVTNVLCGKTEMSYTTVPFLKIAHTMYIHNLIKNLFDFALVRLK